mgnify:CR=1 FL=1
MGKCVHTDFISGDHLILRAQGDSTSSNVHILALIGHPFQIPADRTHPILIGAGVSIPPMIFLAEHIQTMQDAYQALLLGTRDYVQKNGFKTVVVGLSGGIDSSLVATIAADALGVENEQRDQGPLSGPRRCAQSHGKGEAKSLCSGMLRFECFGQ